MLGAVMVDYLQTLSNRRHITPRQHQAAVKLREAGRGWLWPGHADEILRFWPSALRRVWHDLQKADAMALKSRPFPPQPSFTVWRICIESEQPLITTQYRFDYLSKIELNSLRIGLDVVAYCLDTYQNAGEEVEVKRARRARNSVFQTRIIAAAARMLAGDIFDSAESAGISGNAFSLLLRIRSCPDLLQKVADGSLPMNSAAEMMKGMPAVQKKLVAKSSDDQSREAARFLCGREWPEVEMRNLEEALGVGRDVLKRLKVVHRLNPGLLHLIVAGKITVNAAVSLSRKSNVGCDHGIR